MRISDDGLIACVEDAIGFTGEFVVRVTHAINVAKLLTARDLLEATSGNERVSFLVDSIVDPTPEASDGISLTQNLCVPESDQVARSRTVLNVIAAGQR